MATRVGGLVLCDVLKDNPPYFLAPVGSRICNTFLFVGQVGKSSAFPYFWIVVS